MCKQLVCMQAWNKLDLAADPLAIQVMAEPRPNTVRYQYFPTMGQKRG